MHHNIRSSQLPPASPRKKDSRAILDPTAWESSEVTGVEARMLGRRGKSKVSSIRSSLFQKAKGMADQGIEQELTVDTKAPVFSFTDELEAVQAPFLFLDGEALQFCDYGKSNKKFWTKDILAVFHNAVRSELNDLTLLLLSVQKMGSQLRLSDFANIRNWWQTCSGVILDYLDMEVRYIIPWIEQAIENDKRKDGNSNDFVQRMPTRQTAMRELVMNVSKAFGGLCDPPKGNDTKPRQETTVGRNALLVINSLDVLVFELCMYLVEQENKLPEALTAYYRSEKKDKEPILKNLIMHIAKNGRKPEVFFVLLTRWMSDSKAVKSFSKTIQEHHDCNLSGFQTQFEMNHAGFVHQFKVKAGLPN